jgi:glycosyltransferase involved in cell wall biosynthesis
MRIAVLVGDDLSAFLPPIEAVLRTRHEVRRFVCKSAMDVDDALSWCEVAFAEWANEIAVAASTSRIRRPLVVRLHSYEAYPQVGAMKPIAASVDWSRVSRLIYVADHILDALREHVPELPTTTLLPSAIDFSAWPLVDAPTNARSIGIAANVRPNKGLDLAVQIMLRLRDAEPGWHLRVAGAVEDGRLVHYMRWQAERFGLDIRFDGWIPHDWMPTWWASRDVCLSCSYHEGLPFNVVEAMAVGTRPVVHDYIGASRQFPPNTLWTTIDEAIEKIVKTHDPKFRAEFGPSFWRGWVKERNSIERQANQLLELIGNSGSGK